jgi:hypothetical protein
LRDFFSGKYRYLYIITSKKAFYEAFSRSLTLSFLANHQLPIIVRLNIIAVHGQRARYLRLRLPTLYFVIDPSKERIGLRKAMPTDILESTTKGKDISMFSPYIFPNGTTPKQ